MPMVVLDAADPPVVLMESMADHDPLVVSASPMGAPLSSPAMTPTTTSPATGAVEVVAVGVPAPLVPVTTAPRKISS